MAFDLTGTFNRMFTWVMDRDSGIKIMATRMDAEFDNIASGLSNCITRDGYGKPNTAISWNGQRLTNLANGAAPTDAATTAQVDAVAQAVTHITLEQYGGKADWTAANPAPTDNLPALLLAIAAAVNQYAPQFPGWVRARKIVCNLGAYYFSSLPDLKIAVNIEGQGAGYDDFNGGTQFIVAAGQKGFIFNSTDTLAGGVVAVGGTAFGSVIKGITLVSLGGGTQFDGTDAGIASNTSGIWIRTSITLEDVEVINFKGNQIQIVASVFGAGALHGNANGWCFKGRVTTKGRDDGTDGHGVYIKGSDTNCGVCNYINVRQAGLCGYYEDNTLGSVIENIQVDNADKQFKGRVHYLGTYYILVDATAGIGAATVPGTAPSIWYPVGTGVPSVAYPAWSGVGSYRVSMPIFVTGDSCSTRILKAYVEGDLVSDLGGGGDVICLGGTAEWTKRSEALRARHGATRGVLNFRGFGLYNQFTTGEPGYAIYGTYVISQIGGDQGHTPDTGVVLSYECGKDGGVKHVIRYTGTDWYREAGAFAARTPYYRETSTNTTFKAGRVAAVPFRLAIPGVFIGHDNDYSGDDHRWLGFKPSPPNAGEYAKGDVFFNTDHGQGKPLGWRCAVGGTPGTWVPFSIAPIQTYIASATLTGTLVETTLATINVPGGLLGANGVMRVTSLWSATGIGGAKTPRVKFAGNTIWTGTMGANALGSYFDIVQIANRNATNSQISTPPTIGGSYGQNNAALVATAVDTTAVSQITITGQLASVGDTMVLEGYTVEFIPSA